MNWRPRLQSLLTDLSHFPWRTTAVTLRERFREDRLGITASSLTFTTMLALVPFITVALAVFTAFPMFAKVQDVMQKWLIQSLVPDSIARQLLGYLTQFSSKASRLGVAGLAVLLSTALALILTIDHTLNTIWRVPKSRPLAQRVLIYWAAITLGPVLLGLSLSLTSYMLSVTQGVVGGGLGAGLRLLLDTLQFFLLAAGMAALYHYVPNTQVKWSHAWAGGLFVALGIELAKKLLTAYLGLMPTYAMVYGAFAIVPILLIWIYLAWVIVLLGAVIAAYLPSLMAGVARRVGGPGWQFQLALEVLGALQHERRTPQHGLAVQALARQLRVDALQLTPVLAVLTELDWVGQLQDPQAEDEGRYLMLVDPATALLAPLLERLLIGPTDALARLRRNARWDELKLGEAL